MLNISCGSTADTTDVGRENRLLKRRSVYRLINAGDNKMYDHRTAILYICDAEVNYQTNKKRAF